MGDGGDEPDLRPYLIGALVVVLLCLGFIRFCVSFLKTCYEQEEDEEQLDATLQSVCSETGGDIESTSNANNERNDQQCKLNLGNLIAGTLQEISHQSTSVNVNTTTDQPQKPEVGHHITFSSVSNINSVLKSLQEQQNSKENETNVARLNRVRLVQNILQMENAEKPNLANLQAALIIAVDATPSVLAGYCVNLRDMQIEYYIIKMEDFPLRMTNLQDSTEFEMKNLLFAMSIWSERIINLKRLRVYTDNNGILSTSNHGQDVRNLLWHFTKCENVAWVGVHDSYVNRTEDLTAFAKYIQPADDLSRWQVDKAVEFLSKFYGIGLNHVRGTVKLTRHGATTTKPFYEPSQAYTEKIAKSKLFQRKMRRHNCNNIAGLK